MVTDLQSRLSERELNIELTKKAKSWLAKEGYDPVYGARPLRRVIERYVENPVSSQVLRGELKEGDTVLVDLGKDGLTFKTKKKATVEAAA
jgi:ATP-dependent Clp protease ATP-binding subunit ClpC